MAMIVFFERLDRDLSNGVQRLLYSDAMVQVLPQVNFPDHHPILIALNGQSCIKLVSSFKFECGWLTHLDCKDHLAQTWRQDLSLIPNLVNLKQNISVWKYDVFGTIKQRNISVLNRLGGIQQRQYYQRRNPFLEIMENELQKELGDILYQEELARF